MIDLNTGDVTEIGPADGENDVCAAGDLAKIFSVDENQRKCQDMRGHYESVHKPGDKQIVNCDYIRVSDLDMGGGVLGGIRNALFNRNRCPAQAEQEEPRRAEQPQYPSGVCIAQINPVNNTGVNENGDRVRCVDAPRRAVGGNGGGSAR